MGFAFAAPLLFNVRSSSHSISRHAFVPPRVYPLRLRAVMSETTAAADEVSSVPVSQIPASQIPASDTSVVPDADLGRNCIETVDDIREIIALVDEFELLDVRIVDHDVCVEITLEGGLGFVDGKLASPAPVQISTADIAASQQLVPLSEEGEDDGYEAEVMDEEDGEKESLTNEPEDIKDPNTVYDSDFVVTSNRVGFFFSGAKNKPPLVNVGDHVDFNQPVCIIEQLGQQYVYLSEASGTVLRIFVEDGDAVEYGQQVMVIRPD